MDVRVSELSRRGGVPVPTVKFYLREGLLPSGRATSATQAQYDDSHVERLRLVRALLGTGGLSVSAARRVLDQLDHPPDSFHDLIGSAHDELGPAVPTDIDVTEALELIVGLGWQVHPRTSAVRQLAAGVQALRDGGIEPAPELIGRYAEAAHRLGEGDVAGVPTDSPSAAIHFVVVASVLLEPVLLALRRLAQADVSARLLDRGPTGPRSDT